MKIPIGITTKPPNNLEWAMEFAKKEFGDDLESMAHDTFKEVLLVWLKSNA